MTHRMVYNELYKKPKDERKSEIVRIWQVMDQITKVTSELRKCNIDVFEPAVSYILFWLTLWNLLEKLLDRKKLNVLSYYTKADFLYNYS